MQRKGPFTPTEVRPSEHRRTTSNLSFQLGAPTRHTRYHKIMSEDKMSDPVLNATLIPKGDGKNMKDAEVPCCQHRRKRICRLLFVTFLLSLVVKVACCIHQRQQRMEFDSALESNSWIRSGHKYSNTMDERGSQIGRASCRERVC